MSPDVNVYGVYVPALALIGLTSLGINLCIRKLFSRMGLYRLVWHRPLFDAACYVCLVGMATILYDRISS